MAVDTLLGEHANHSSSADHAVAELSPGSKAVVVILAWSSAGTFAFAIVVVLLIYAWKVGTRIRRKRAKVPPNEDAPIIAESKHSSDGSKENISTKISIATLSIEGMSCSACSSTVEHGLSALEGVTKVQVDLLASRCIIHFRSPSDSETVIDAVEGLGFDASLLSIEAESPIEPEQVATFTRVTLSIQGMSCSACSDTLQRVLNEADGVTKADVNLLANKAVVMCKSNVDPKQLCDLVDEFGFDAALVSVENDRSTSAAISMSFTLAIEGMSCSACSSAVEKALRALQGVSRADVNLLANKASVTCEPGMKPEALCEVIEDIGFDASVLTSDEVRLPEQSMPGAESNAAARFQNSLPNKSSTCLLRIAFPSSVDLKDVRAALSTRAGVSGVVVDARARELRVTYWSHDVGARVLLEEQKACGASWAGDARLKNDDHLLRMERAQLMRYLFSVPPTAAIFMIAFVIPNLFPESIMMEAINGTVCCGGALSWQTLLLLVLVVPVQFGSGLTIHRAACKAVLIGHMSMDVLVSLGTTLAFTYSLMVTVAWMVVGVELPLGLASSHDGHGGSGTGSVAPPPHFFEASAILLNIIMLGELMKMHAKRRSGDALRRLAKQFPSEARLANDSKKIPCDLLHIADLVAITVGETLPCDGVVESGDMQVDESVLTGEGRPVRKLPGDLVVGGSKCIDGTVNFKATAVGANTAMSQIASMVESAQASKPNIEQVASQVSAVFVPTILGLCLLTFIVWATLVASGTVEVPSALAAAESISQKEARLAEQSFFVSRFALALMMMACPCAFGLATPTAVLVSTSVAARRGCLVKSGRALEVAGSLKAVVLDKTGTVTVGAPAVTSVALNADHVAFARPFPESLKPVHGSQAVQSTWLRCIDEPQPADASSPSPSLVQGPPTDTSNALLWAAVGAVEASSQHPLGKALFAQAKQICPQIPEVQQWRGITGLGVEGYVSGLGLVRVGRRTWVCESFKRELECECGICQCSFEQNCGCRCWEKSEADTDTRPEAHALLNSDKAGNSPQCCCKPGMCACSSLRNCGCRCWESNAVLGPMSALDQWFEDTASHGASVVSVGLDGELLGFVVLKDVLQTGAIEVVDALQRLGIQVWLCSGDLRSTTRAVASQLGIEHWVGEALPRDKAHLVNTLSSNGFVCFTGDGVNDAPALAAASLGVAIGAGAHVTVDAADVVLVRSAVKDLLDFIKLSRKTLLTIKFNFVWAFGFNIVGLPLAAGVLYPTVHLPPVVAGAAMAGSSLVVILNSLRLRSFGRAGVVNSDVTAPFDGKLISCTKLTV